MHKSGHHPRMKWPSKPSNPRKWYPTMCSTRIHCESLHELMYTKTITKTTTYPIKQNAMHCGYNAKQSKSQKERSAHPTISRCSEMLKQGNCSRHDAEDGNHNQINHCSYNPVSNGTMHDTPLHSHIPCKVGWQWNP